VGKVQARRELGINLEGENNVQICYESHHKAEKSETLKRDRKNINNK